MFNHWDNVPADIVAYTAFIRSPWCSSSVFESIFPRRSDTHHGWWSIIIRVLVSTRITEGRSLSLSWPAWKARSGRLWINSSIPAPSFERLRPASSWGRTSKKHPKLLRPQQNVYPVLRACLLTRVLGELWFQTTITPTWLNERVQDKRAVGHNTIHLPLSQMISQKFWCL